MGLCADTVDELAVCVGALHEGDHTLNFGIVGVEVEVVDVQLSVGISSTGGFECDGNKRL